MQEEEIIEIITNIRQKYDLNEVQYCNWLALVKAFESIEDHRDKLEDEEEDFKEKNDKSRDISKYVSAVGGDLYHSYCAMRNKLWQTSDKFTFRFFVGDNVCTECESVDGIVQRTIQKRMMIDDNAHYILDKSVYIKGDIKLGDRYEFAPNGDLINQPIPEALLYTIGDKYKGKVLNPSDIIQD